jgi:RNA polymerase sigma-70 factor (ECF subfamily)
MPTLVRPRLDIASLYAATREGLWVYAMSILRDESAAEDVVHDAFARLMARTAGEAGFQPDCPRSYVFASARHLALNRLRELDTLKRKTPEARPYLAWKTPPSPEEAARRAEELAGIHAQLDRLPAEQREALLLRTQSGLTFAEIGEVTGVPLQTAMSRYRYAVAALREAMD